FTEPLKKATCSASQRPALDSDTDQRLRDEHFRRFQDFTHRKMKQGTKFGYITSDGQIQAANRILTSIVTEVAQDHNERRMCQALKEAILSIPPNQIAGMKLGFRSSGHWQVFADALNRLNIQRLVSCDIGKEDREEEDPTGKLWLDRDVATLF